jgi:hypothetical protein
MITDFCNKIHCINKDSESKRWLRSVAEFASIHLYDVERFPAIEHSKPHIGCRKSHQAIIQKAREEFAIRLRGRAYESPLSPEAKPPLDAWTK